MPDKIKTHEDVQNELLNLQDKLGSKSNANVGPLKFSPDAFSRSTYVGKSAYDRLGFSPTRDNHTKYARETTGGEITKDALVGFGTNLKNFDLFGVSIGAKVGSSEAVRDFERAMAIGTPIGDKGAYGYLAEQATNAGFTGSIITSIAIEDTVLSALTAITYGGNAPIQAAWMAGKLARVAKYVYKGSKTVKRTKGTLRAMEAAETLRLLDRASDITKVRKAVKFVGDKAGDLLIPNLKANKLHLDDLARNGEKATKLEAVSKTGVAIWKEAREWRLAYGEAQLESSFLNKDVLAGKIEQYKQQTGNDRVPDDILEGFKKQANYHSNRALNANIGVIYASNKLALGFIFKKFRPRVAKFGVKRGAHGTTYEVKSRAGGGILNRKPRVGGQEFIRDGFLKSKVDWSRASSRVKAKAAVSMAKTFAKTGVGEGIQEYTQEIIQHAEMRMAMSNDKNIELGKTFNDYAKSAQHFRSKEGFKIFASGFTMGGFSAPVQFAASSAVKLATGAAQLATGNFKDSRAEVVKSQELTLKNIEEVNKLYESMNGADFNMSKLLGDSVNKENAEALMKAVNEGDEDAYAEIMNKSNTDFVSEIIANGSYENVLDYYEQISKLTDNELEDLMGDELHEKGTTDEDGVYTAGKRMSDSAVNEKRKYARSRVEISIKELKEQKEFSDVVDKIKVNPFNRYDSESDDKTGASESGKHKAFNDAKALIKKNRHNYRQVLNDKVELEGELSDLLEGSGSLKGDVIDVSSIKGIKSALYSLLNEIEAEALNENKTEDDKKKLKNNKQKIVALNRILDVVTKANGKAQHEKDRVLTKDDKVIIKSRLSAYFSLLNKDESNSNDFSIKNIEQITEAVFNLYDKNLTLDDIKDASNKLDDTSYFNDVVNAKAKVNDYIWSKKKEIIGSGFHALDKQAKTNKFIKKLDDAGVFITQEAADKLLSKNEKPKKYFHKHSGVEVSEKDPILKEVQAIVSDYTTDKKHRNGADGVVYREGLSIELNDVADDDLSLLERAAKRKIEKALKNGFEISITGKAISYDKDNRPTYKVVYGAANVKIKLKSTENSIKDEKSESKEVNDTKKLNEQIKEKNKEKRKEKRDKRKASRKAKRKDFFSRTNKSNETEEENSEEETKTNANTNTEEKTTSEENKVESASDTDNSYPDKRVPLKREKFTITDKDGGKRVVTVITMMDGSLRAETESFDKNGKSINVDIETSLGNNSIIIRDGITAEQAVKNTVANESLGDVVEKTSEENGTVLLSPKRLARLSDKQKERLGISKKTDNKRDTSKEIEEGLSSMGKGFIQAANERAAKLLQKDGKLSYNKKESAEAARNNPHYNTVENSQGGVDVIGIYLEETDTWVGTPSSQSELDKINKEEQEELSLKETNILERQTETNNVPLSDLEYKVAEKIIEKGIKDGLSADEIYTKLRNRKFNKSGGITVVLAKEYIQARIDGKTTVKYGESQREFIKAKYKAKRDALNESKGSTQQSSEADIFLKKEDLSKAPEFAQKAISKTVEAIPEDVRLKVVKKAYEGITADFIAKELNLTTAQVRSIRAYYGVPDVSDKADYKKWKDGITSQLSSSSNQEKDNKNNSTKKKEVKEKKPELYLEGVKVVDGTSSVVKLIGYGKNFTIDTNSPIYKIVLNIIKRAKLLGSNEHFTTKLNKSIASPFKLVSGTKITIRTVNEETKNIDLNTYEYTSPVTLSEALLSLDYETNKDEFLEIYGLKSEDTGGLHKVTIKNKDEVDTYYAEDEITANWINDQGDGNTLISLRHISKEEIVPVDLAIELREAKSTIEVNSMHSKLLAKSRLTTGEQKIVADIKAEIHEKTKESYHLGDRVTVSDILHPTMLKEKGGEASDVKTGIISSKTEKGISISSEDNSNSSFFTNFEDMVINKNRIDGVMENTKVKPLKQPDTKVSESGIVYEEIQQGLQDKNDDYTISKKQVKNESKAFDLFSQIDNGISSIDMDNLDEKVKNTKGTLKDTNTENCK